MPSTPESKHLGVPISPIANITTRHMVRSYFDTPVDDVTLEPIIRAGLSGPSAGNTRSVEMLVLRSPDRELYWDVTLPPQRRETFPWPGLLRAPVLLIPYVRPGAYVERYSEEDKADTGLGGSAEAWPVPFWWVDGGAAAQNVLLAAHSLGLGACLFGQFDNEVAVKDRFGVPDDHRAVCTIAIGHPDRASDRVSLSARRPRRPIDDITHHGTW